MTRWVDVETAEVWRGDERVGTLSRTRTGAVFAYDEAFFERHRGEEGGIAVHLPYRRRRHEARGTNLHPFFAGLLPEGLRLRTLLSTVKTSADDLLSLLLAIGRDTIGDIVVVPAGQPPYEGEVPPPLRLEELSFKELFERSLGKTGLEPVVPGVQEKVSASMISFPLPSSRGVGGHILKLNPPDKPRLVENGFFFMRMAADCGLRTATVRLVHDRGGEAGLLVDRFDRVRRGRRVFRIHQEDACQFLDLYPSDKYRVTTRQIADGVLEAATAPIPDIASLLGLVAFSYAIANGDLHAKNVSLLADGPRGGLRLSPAYDPPLHASLRRFSDGPSPRREGRQPAALPFRRIRRTLRRASRRHGEAPRLSLQAGCTLARSPG